MDITSFFGFLAGILTTISFVPQLLKVLKTKSTKDISLAMFIIFTVGVFCWLVYGILSASLPIIVSNLIMVILASVILAFKIKYK